MNAPLNINDPQDMAGYIRDLPKNLQDAWKKGFEFNLPEFPLIKQILVCGMGGSAIGGDLLGSYLSELMPVPVSSWRNYGLPAYAQGENCLVICSSHSGNTEETLDALKPRWHAAARLSRSRPAVNWNKSRGIRDRALAV